MFRLLRYYSITSFIATGLIALSLVFFFGYLVRHSLLHLGEKQNVAMTRAFSNALWPILEGLLDPELGSIDRRSLGVHPLIPILDRQLRLIMENLEVMEIKIYSPQGMTVYATHLNQIGQKHSGNSAFKRAVQGEVVSSMALRPDVSSLEGVIEDRHLIESLVPLNRGGKILGVFELYYDISTVLDHISSAQTRMVAGVGGLFLILYFTLFGLVRRADRIIAQQNGQLQEYLAQITEINASLEQRVEDRTETLNITNQVLKEEIIERQIAEAELTKLSRAVEQSPASVLITDTEGRIEYVNPTFQRVSGYSLEEVVGKNPKILKSGKVAAQDYEQLWTSIQNGHEWRGELLNRKKNGELFWELASISPIRNRLGRITHFVAVKEDITNRKQAEERLQRSEARLRSIMDNVMEGILSIQKEGSIESVNPSMQRIFGYTDAEMVGAHVGQFLGEPFIYIQKNRMARYLSFHARKRSFIDTEIRADRKDGSKVPLEVTLIDVQSPSGIHYIATIRDISERKKAEKELEEARRSYYHQEKMASIGTLAAGIVHEIGNPITAISGLIEALRDSLDNLGTEDASLLNMIDEQVRRLTSLIRDVREFSMPQSDEMDLLVINDLVGACVRLMRFDKRTRNINILLQLGQKIPAISGSGNQLRQVIINLLINASDALEGIEGRKPEVVLATQVLDGKLLLTVTDNGIGMDPKTRDQAFDAFFTTKPVGKGTGLGLSLCYSIIAKHGGTMEIESELGKGTTLKILLPILELKESHEA
ncbi:MAG: PAS domain S-box protein [Magnetococcus sp. DMHC-6]